MQHLAKEARTEFSLLPLFATPTLFCCCCLSISPQQPRSSEGYMLSDTEFKNGQKGSYSPTDHI